MANSFFNLNNNPGKVRVFQEAHGFLKNQWLMFDGLDSEYKLAQADTQKNSVAIGIVTDIVDEDNILLQTYGRVVEMEGLVPGDQYYLSPSIPGAATNVKPSGIVRPLFIAVYPSIGYINNQSIESGLMPSSVLSANANLAPNESYFTDSGGVIDLTLPLAPQGGTMLRISNISGGFSLICQGLDSIMIGTLVSTPGAGGSVDTQADGDSITLEYEAVNQVWVANAMIGTFTII